MSKQGKAKPPSPSAPAADHEQYAANMLRRLREKLWAVQSEMRPKHLRSGEAQLEMMRSTCISLLRRQVKAVDNSIKKVRRLAQRAISGTGETTGLTEAKNNTLELLRLMDITDLVLRALPVTCLELVGGAKSREDGRLTKALLWFLAQDPKPANNVGRFPRPAVSILDEALKALEGIKWPSSTKNHRRRLH